MRTCEFCCSVNIPCLSLSDVLLTTPFYILVAPPVDRCVERPNLYWAVYHIEEREHMDF